VNPISWIFVAAIRAYQYLVSPLIGPTCRFMPSCSDYAREAVVMHGPIFGPWLALRRLLRCHPWGGQGWDPVPPAAHRCRNCH
jgi:putative membrane protein insertion efficiency factor